MDGREAITRRSWLTLACGFVLPRPTRYETHFIKIYKKLKGSTPLQLRKAQDEQ
jgi:hypothetical protein